VPVVHFQDLNVVVVRERRRHAFDQGEQQVDAEAHVRRLDNGGVQRRPFDGLLLRKVEAGRADHVRDLGLRRELGVRDGGRRHREVDHRVGLGEEIERIVADREAERPEADQFPEIAANRVGLGGLGPAGDLAALGRVHGAEQHAAHAPGAADDSDLHAVHGRRLRALPVVPGGLARARAAGKGRRSRPHGSRDRRRNCYSVRSSQNSLTRAKKPSDSGLVFLPLLSDSNSRSSSS